MNPLSNARTQRATLRRAAAVLIIALLAFLGLSLLAARAYPGGTYCEPAATTYRFWGNFFCDLTAPITRRGEDNTLTAAYARAAFGAFALALLPFFWILGTLAGKARGTVRTLGTIAGIVTLGLAWVPSRASPILHALFVFTATLPALIAATLGALAVLRRGRQDPSLRLIAGLGMLALTLSALDAAGYAHALATSADCVAWLPALQKLAAITVVTWMAGVAVYGSRGE